MRLGGLAHIVGNLLTRVTILLQTSPQSEACTQSYGPPKLGPKVAGVPTLGISGLPFGSLGQNDIWVLVPWLGTKYAIKEKVVASLKI